MMYSNPFDLTRLATGLRVTATGGAGSPLSVGCIALLLHFDPVLHHLGASDLFAVKFHSAFGAVVRPCHRVHFLSNVSWCQTMQINLINDTMSVSSVFGTNILNLRQIGRKGPFLYTNIKIVLKIV